MRQFKKFKNNRSFYRRINLNGKHVQRGKKWRATKSRLKSRGRNQLSSTNFPFGAARHPERWRVFTELLGRQLAIDFRPEKPRGALCRAESGCGSGCRQLHPRWSNIIGKTVPSERGRSRPCQRTRRYIKITCRCATTVQKFPPSPL